MSKKSLDLKQGIKAHMIHTELYKTNMVCIIMTVPLNKENVTKNALIPAVLRRGTNKYPTMKKISIELENL